MTHEIRTGVIIMQPSSNERLRKISVLSWHPKHSDPKELSSSTNMSNAPTESSSKPSTGQKDVYKEKVVADNDDECDGDTIVNEWRRINHLLQDTSEQANEIPGFHLMFVAVHDDKHLVGGTEMGGNFLRESGSSILRSFLGYVSSDKLVSYHSLLPNFPPKKARKSKDAKDTLRRCVENLFNRRYAECIGDSTARFPYKKIQEYGISVSGLPEDKYLKHPSSYGRLTLRQILANKDNVIVKVSNHPSLNKSKKTDDTTSSNSTFLNNGIVQDKELQDSSTPDGIPELLPLINEETDKNDLCTSDYSKTLSYSKYFPVTPGDKVQLLLNSKRVGIGTVRTTNQLYGHHIPVNFVPISVDTIDTNICPIYMSSVDEPFLYVGQLTAWPIEQLAASSVDI